MLPGMDTRFAVNRDVRLAYEISVRPARIRC
jgi:hypothetical protein